MPRCYRKHGRTKTKLYRVWQSMKERCCNPKSNSYFRYGGRGIAVCKEWINNFEAFRRDMGPKPPSCTLERKDNNKGYSPKNCVWATRHAQTRNTRRNRFIEFGGERMCVTDWAKRLGMKPHSLRKRLLHWPTDVALSMRSGGYLYGDSVPLGARYRGVSKKRNGWRARFKNTHIGTFATAKAAAKAYREFVAHSQRRT